MTTEVLHADDHFQIAPHTSADARACDHSSSSQVAALHAGDGTCWNQFLSRMEKRCLALAWRILNDSHLAADAVQSGFMSAYRARRVLHASSAVEQWLLTTVANAARDAARKRERAGNAIEELQQNAQNISAADSAGECENEIRSALAKLDEQSRLTFLLVHQEGFSYQDVAMAFGWPIGTVRSKLHRARLRLRELLHGTQSESDRRKRKEQNQ
jgi:RNA polymerase sigma-70 factor, ECF subfamily